MSRCTGMVLEAVNGSPSFTQAYTSLYNFNRKYLHKVVSRILMTFENTDSVNFVQQLNCVVFVLIYKTLTHIFHGIDMTSLSFKNVFSSREFVLNSQILRRYMAYTVSVGRKKILKLSFQQHSLIRQTAFQLKIIIFTEPLVVVTCTNQFITSGHFFT